jgi:hypothetical protein
MLRATHTLFLHHDDHDRPVCEAGYRGNTKHIHDERYGVRDECPLCAFLFSVPELISMASAVQLRSSALTETAMPVYDLPRLLAPHDPCLRRGPPALG